MSSEYGYSHIMDVYVPYASSKLTRQRRQGKIFPNQDDSLAITVKHNTIYMQMKGKEKHKMK
jgi:hypothetical protein